MTGDSLGRNRIDLGNTKDAGATPARSTTVSCAECGIDFNRLAKEIRRQERKGRKHHFCSLSCSMKNTNKHMSEWTKKLKLANLRSRKGVFKNKSFGMNNRLLHRGIKNHGGDKTIDTGFLEDLWKKQSGRCAITNMPLKLRTWRDKATPTSASIDRIDCTKGYEKDNVQFVAYSVNLARNAFDINDIKTFFYEVITHMENKSV